jgi:hypothetical protein
MPLADRNAAREAHKLVKLASTSSGWNLLLSVSCQHDHCNQQRGPQGVEAMADLIY